jgi:ABC-type transport system substrate-binding protein
MASRLSRRAVMAGAAAAGALPFLRIPGARARTPGVLTFGLSSYPPSLEPWVNNGTAAATIKLMTFRGLTSYGPDGNLRPELAESWEPVGTAGWSFKLRDATFHNGEKVTSADVRWNIEQIAADRSTAHFREELKGVEKIETPDDRTVRIFMKQPRITLPEMMASYRLPIVSRNSPRGAAIGAGPFIVKAQERGVSVTLEAYDKFYRPGFPKLKGIRAVAYADENLRVAALQSGDVDLIEYVPWHAMDTIAANPQLKMDAVDGAFMYLVFNGARKPFDDARVRRAVAHAIKRDELVKAAFSGRGSPLQQLPIPPASSFYNPEYKDGWRYDPDLARKLLAEAGHANGFSCSLASTAQYGMHKDTAEVVQQHLAAVGIKAELNLPDWATRVSLGNRGQFDIGVMGTAADSNDPDGLANLVDGSLAPSFSRSVNLKIDRITELFAAGRAEYDEAKRKAIYRELEGLAIEQAPFIGLTWRSQAYAMRRDVAGFTNLPGALTFYSGLTFETASIG